MVRYQCKKLVVLARDVHADLKIYVVLYYISVGKHVVMKETFTMATLPRTYFGLFIYSILNNSKVYSCFFASTCQSSDLFMV